MSDESGMNSSVRKPQDQVSSRKHSQAKSVLQTQVLSQIVRSSLSIKPFSHKASDLSKTVVQLSELLAVTTTPHGTYNGAQVHRHAQHVTRLPFNAHKQPTDNTDQTKTTQDDLYTDRRLLVVQHERA